MYIFILYVFSSQKVGTGIERIFHVLCNFFQLVHFGLLSFMATPSKFVVSQIYLGNELLWALLMFYYDLINYDSDCKYNPWLQRR